MPDEKKTLKTSLKKELFDAVLTGEKTVDYRDCSPYWKARLMEKGDNDQYAAFREYDTVLIRNGNGVDARLVEVAFEGTRIYEYSEAPEEGEDEDIYYFAISLGKVLRVENQE